jgi:hypothetical protein
MLVTWEIGGKEGNLTVVTNKVKIWKGVFSLDLFMDFSIDMLLAP